MDAVSASRKGLPRLVSRERRRGATTSSHAARADSSAAPSNATSERKFCRRFRCTTWQITGWSCYAPVDSAPMGPSSPATAPDDGAPVCGAGAVRLRVRVMGVVQGVGFRPFVHRVAHRLGVAGSVRNTSGGAELELEAASEVVEAFLQELRLRPPPIARVDSVVSEPIPLTGEPGFRIVESLPTSEQAALVSPDVAVCDDCLAEMRAPGDRRHRYPFLNCTNCGPRFSIVRQVPYDRAETTMASFPLCAPCTHEFADPLDRRYHAQPIACPVCGPSVTLVASDGSTIAQRGEAIDRARSMLAEGRIVAVKGLGGFHLACDASNAAAVARLRERKPRRHKPLAIMCRDLDAVRACCEVSDSELRELSAPRRPILLLARRAVPSPIAGQVAPGHGELGVMLPYTPLHAMLLEPGAPPCLVMTSGNRTGGPIEISNDEAVRVLGSVADALLVHDREIWNRCDDSVAAVCDDRLMVLRRSRGFVPLPVDVDADLRPTFAVGAMFANVFALGRGGRVFLSQHIGDVDDADVLDFLEESYGKLRRWLAIDPEVVVHDVHPDLLTTHLAKRVAGDARVVAVQHHHAHLASAMAAARIAGPVQGLVFDGTGYGLDGGIWGGELLVGDAARVRRAGHLRELLLPGGDAATRRPLRIAAAWLHQLVPGADAVALDLWSRGDPEEFRIVRQMVDRRFNTSRTTSGGRLFDAVSSLLGVCDDASYEGQAAIELEQLATHAPEWQGPSMSVSGEIGRITIDPAPWFEGVVEAILRGADRAELARGFHRALAGAMAEACRRVVEGGGPRRVVLCGGVFQNRTLVRMVASELEARGMEAVSPGAVPVNDGGLALGQVMVANAARLDAAAELAVGWED